ncbi:MAG: caspase family protein [Bacteroidota bacterium]
MSETRKPNLYALLVGINDYEVDRVSDLKGCVDDVKRMKAYLEKAFVQKNFDLPPQIKVLTDSAASKKAILKGFTEHLAKAEDGDSILFYFSGHGMREHTDMTVFTQDEIDGKIASIVCADSNPWKHKEDGKLAPISDKELRYHLHLLGLREVNIVTIFDCCHSGENTRSMAVNDGPTSTTRQLERQAFPPRARSGFDFNGKEKEILTRGIEGINLFSLLPEATHVQMASCKEVELARESPKNAEVRKGVFTQALLDVLTQFEGDINYDDLYLRVLNRMTQYIQSEAHEEGDNPAQTPQMYIKSDDSTHRYKTFLTNAPSDKVLSTNVVLGGDPGDPDVDQVWRITSGSLQGIPIDQTKSPSKLTIKSSKQAGEWKAKIKKVFPGYCLIEYEADIPPKVEVEEEVEGEKVLKVESRTDATLYAEIEGLGIDPLNLFITGPDTEGVAFAKKEFTKILEEAEQKNYRLVEEEVDANYTLFIKEGVLFCTKPFKHNEPVVQGIAIKTKSGEYLDFKIRIANEDLIQMATWHFLKGLEHKEDHDISAFTDEDKTMFPVELKVYVFDEETETESRLFPNKHGIMPLDVGNVQHFFRVEIENHSNINYYCSLVTLSDLYGVNLAFMNSPQLLLGPGNDGEKVLSSKGISKGGKKYLRFSISQEKYDYVRHYNQDSISFFFKLVVSATPFSVESLAMDELPHPIPFDKIELPDTRSAASKSLSFFDYEPEQPEIDWEIHNFELVVPNYLLKKEAIA